MKFRLWEMRKSHRASTSPSSPAALFYYIFYFYVSISQRTEFIGFTFTHLAQVVGGCSDASSTSRAFTAADVTTFTRRA